MAPSLLEQLLMNLDEAVLVCDGDGYVLHANRSARTLLTKSLDWMHSKPIDSWLRSRNSLIWPENGESHDIDLSFEDINHQEHWARASIRTIPVMGGRGWMIVFRDHQAASQRLAGLESLCGGIATQLSDQLEIILENASKALLASPNETFAAPIRTILEAGQNAAVLKRQLKAITGEGQAMRVSLLSSLVKDCIPLMSSILGDESDIRVELNEDTAWVECDEASIRLALLHLAEWLAKNQPRAGTVLIEVTHPADSQQTVLLRIATAQRFRDNSAEYPHFQPSLPEHSNTGLALVYGIVEQHNGRLLLNASPNEGAALHIEFPTSDKTPGESDNACGLASGNETILVVDDDPATIEVVSQLLEDQGFSVLTASNGTEASALIHQKHKEIDVFLTDAVLPGRSGLELISEMKSISPQMPVLLMSGYPAEFMGGQVRPDIPLLGKPFSPGTLITRLRGLLDTEP